MSTSKAPGFHSLPCKLDDGKTSNIRIAFITGSLPFGKTDLSDESAPMCDSLAMCLYFSILMDHANETTWDRIRDLFEAEKLTSKNSGTLPLNWNVSSKVTFSIVKNKIVINSRDMPGNINTEVDYLFNRLTSEINERQKYFLSLSDTLGICLVRNNEKYFSTICRKNTVSSILVHDSVPPKNLNRVFDISKNWKAVRAFGDIYASGAHEIPNDHFIAMYSGQDGENITKKVKYSGDCIFGHKGQTTIEHCTPKWLADSLRAQPITCKLLCEDCNTNFFGKQFEVKMSQLFFNKQICDNDNRNFVALWCVKTALFISAAANVPLKHSWLDSLYNKQIPNGFQIFVSDMHAKPNCYYAIPTIFNGQRTEKGCFFFQFICDGMCFIVVNSPERSIPDDFSAIPQIYPKPNHISCNSRQAQVLNGIQIAKDYFSFLTGEEVDFKPTSNLRM